MKYLPHLALHSYLRRSRASHGCVRIGCLVQCLCPLPWHAKPRQPLALLAGAAGAPAAMPAGAAVHVGLEVNRVASTLTLPERPPEIIAGGEMIPLSAPVQKWQYWLTVCKAASDRLVSRPPEIASNWEKKGVSECARVRGRASGGRVAACLPLPLPPALTISLHRFQIICFSQPLKTSEETEAWLWLGANVVYMQQTSNMMLFIPIDLFILFSIYQTLWHIPKGALLYNTLHTVRYSAWFTLCFVSVQLYEGTNASVLYLLLWLMLQTIAIGFCEMGS